MIKRFISAVLWSQAVHQSGKDKPQKSLDLIRRMHHLVNPTSYSMALEAGLLLRTRKFEDAKKLFLEVINKTSGLYSSDEKYVNLFANAMVSGMHGDLDDEQKSIQEAKKINCRPALRRYLPL